MSKKFLISAISVACGLFLLFATIFALVLANGKAPFAVDTSIANWAYDIRGEKGNFFYWFFTIVTEFGHYYFLIAFFVVMAIVWKCKSKTWFLFGTVGVSWALGEIVKLIVQRPRPDSDMWWGFESSTSFPSGHSSTVICLFVLIVFFVVISPYLQKWVKGLLISLSCVAMVLVPLSRIILGMHYFSDVVAGMLWGGMFAVLGMLAYKLYLNFKAKKQANTQTQIEEQTKKDN